MKTAVIHEWLVNYAGSERVLEQILHVFPEADLFCQIDFLSNGERGFILNKKVRTSFIQKLPSAKTGYRNYLPLMPFAVRRFDLSDYALIISNSHSVAKGVRKNSKQLHICYCHTPMRYAWDLRDQYLKETGLDSGIKGAVVEFILNRIRKWDFETAQRVDCFIANSSYIKERIKRVYKRDSEVIYPPVDIDRFKLNDKKDDYFLAVSRMVPYKKMDLIVEAFSETGLPLVVIGEGPDLEKVKSRAKKNVEFLGFQEREILVEYVQKARAFVFAAEEDFGIVAVEAQACGTPVIAYGKGGATETVIPFGEVRSQKSEVRSRGVSPYVRTEEKPTGIFFYEQTASALIDAVKRFITVEDKYDPYAIRKNAERFGVDRFRKEFKDFVERKIAGFSPSP
ncbi:MAG: glycosyltransferase family 4 protein [Nitrospirae bacterium]|nr:glycosyltransferase family 4 protein [Nitrospirota bacterium]